MVDKLQQPVALVTAAADQALTGMSDSMAGLEQRIEANIRSSVAELRDDAERYRREYPYLYTNPIYVKP